MALRMPISRVRSVTVTSMMFMTPMPPTSSEIAATAPSSTVKTWFDASLASRRSAWLSTWKSAVVTLCVESKVDVICADAASEAPRDFAWTVIWL